MMSWIKVVSILGLSLFFTRPTDYVKEYDQIIARIDQNAILKDSSSFSEDSTTITYRIYRLDEYKKIEFLMRTETDLALDWDISYYYFKNHLLVRKERLLAPYLKKGASQQPDFYLSESHYYFKHKKKGVLFERSIDGYHQQSVDSLRLVLDETSFEKSKLDEQDYRECMDQQKRMKKNLS
jgi:hypothetical protein